MGREEKGEKKRGKKCHFCGWLEKGVEDERGREGEE